MATTTTVTLAPTAWTALSDVVEFTFTNSGHGNVLVKVAASPPAVTSAGKEGSHVLLADESMNRLALGVHYVYCDRAKTCAFTEDDS